MTSMDPGEARDLDRLLSGGTPSGPEAARVLAAGLAAAHPRRRWLRLAIPGLAAAAATATALLLVSPDRGPGPADAPATATGPALVDGTRPAPAGFTARGGQAQPFSGEQVRGQLTCERPMADGACPAGSTVTLVVEREEHQAVAAALLASDGTLTWFSPGPDDHEGGGAAQPGLGPWVRAITLPQDTPAGRHALWVLTSPGPLDQDRARSALIAVQEQGSASLGWATVPLDVAAPAGAAGEGPR